jgi:hypothetical protein
MPLVETGRGGRVGRGLPPFARPGAPTQRARRRVTGVVSYHRDPFGLRYLITAHVKRPRDAHPMCRLLRLHDELELSFLFVEISLVKQQAAHHEFTRRDQFASRRMKPLTSLLPTLFGGMKSL